MFENQLHFLVIERVYVVVFDHMLFVLLFTENHLHIIDELIDVGHLDILRWRGFYWQQEEYREAEGINSASCEPREDLCDECVQEAKTWKIEEILFEESYDSVHVDVIRAPFIRKAVIRVNEALTHELNDPSNVWDEGYKVWLYDEKEEDQPID